MNGILVDVTRCRGCNRCIEACAEDNQLKDQPLLPQHAPDGLSANCYAAIVPGPEGRHVRKFCRHCLEPACVSVCPVGAMVQTAEGAVVYDASKCMGCRYCMMACPFGIPRYEWDSAAPVVAKCDLCYDRLQAGKSPACVEACPEEALIFGAHSDLLHTAHERVQNHPQDYLPMIYGEHEAGGTSVMYVSDVPLDFLAFNKPLGEKPLPDLTWNWLEKVPGLSLSTAGLMTGLFWIIGRRMQAEEARAKGKSQEDECPPEA